MKYKIGYATGVFDMFHIGHLNLLKRAKEQCDYLIVGVNSGDLVRAYKSKSPVIPTEERRLIVEACRYVDRAVVVEVRDKIDAYHKFGFDVVFVGDDWKGSESYNKMEEELNELGVEIVYLPYTQGTSSTLMREVLNEIAKKI